jgi:hypothetical protein
MANDIEINDVTLLLIRSALMLSCFGLTEIAAHAGVKRKEAKAFFESHLELFDKNPEPRVTFGGMKWDFRISSDSSKKAKEKVHAFVAQQRLGIDVLLAEPFLHEKREDDYEASAKDFNTVAGYLLEAQFVLAHDPEQAARNPGFLQRLRTAEKLFVTQRDSRLLVDESNERVTPENAEQKRLHHIFKVGAPAVV